ncbi:MAG: hypothetical protein QOE69_2232 [Thermoleophilaceae bacterium]|jgi:hypothetical protein|nr:hypothetical protein [Thermoleophilaceae bacterium]MEA2408113.1 hypothetical protein [Thermoleophilaceae bacterium]
MSEGREEGDRFDDLSVGDRLAERDRTHPEPMKRPEVPRQANKYAWLVGIVMFMVLGVLVFVQTIPNQGEGLFGPEPGERLPPFAAPLVQSSLEGDANVCQREPCPKNSGPVPACEVKSKDVLNVCTLRDRPLVITFVFDRGADCFPQVDRTERVRGSVPGVRFVTVYFSRKERSELRNLMTARGWTQPVAVDSDGQVANLYGVGGCPTTVFARAGGKVAQTKLGNLTEAQLRRGAQRLLE